MLLAQLISLIFRSRLGDITQPGMGVRVMVGVAVGVGVQSVLELTTWIAANLALLTEAGATISMRPVVTVTG
jgi:hypothetical protein